MKVARELSNVPMLARLLLQEVIYTLKRGIAYYIWIGQMISVSHTGSYPDNPQLQVLLSNICIPIFLIVCLVFYVLAYRSGIRKNNI